MNERIKKLAEEAGMNIKTNVIGTALVFGTFEGYKTSHISVEELEKFAELVVRECISFYSPDDSATDWADKMRRVIEP
jgi:hypothetical protein